MAEETEEEAAARKQQCKALAALETRGERSRRRLGGALCLVAGLISAVVLWSASSWFLSIQGGPANSATSAVAVTQSCERSGPISTSGIGSWWNCSALVKGPSGQSAGELVEFQRSELTPADIGKQVRVTAESATRSNSSVSYRDTERPLWILHMASLCGSFASLLVGVGFTAMRLLPLHDWMEIDKRKFLKIQRQYEREGRILPTSSQAPPPQASEQYPPPPPPPYQPGPGQ